MSTSRAERESEARARSFRRPALVLLVILTLGVAACGAGDGGREEASGNAGSGKFDPPPLETDVPEAVREACDAPSPTIERIKQNGVLFWAIGVTPPFGFKLESGEWAGVEAQNAAELATILGVDFDITEYTYDLLPQTLVDGEADIVGAQLFVTAERKKLIDFSTPYYRSGQLFYVREDSPYQTIDDLNKPDVRFVYGFGAGQLVLAKKYAPRAKITDAPLAGKLLLYDYLVANRADATMTDATPMKLIFERFRNPPLAAIGLNGRVTTERASAADMLDPFDVAFGLPKGDKGWRDCVNAWVQDLLDSGRMAERLDYWLAQPVA